MECFRCHKQIAHPDETNADYILADDTKVAEAGREIQKTGIVCPECYKDGDILIWGIHKNRDVSDV